MCGVWIASWADDDEQYKEEQPREGLFLAGAMNWWEELSHLSLSLFLIFSLSLSFSLINRPNRTDPSRPFAMWVASPIFRGPGPLPKYRAGREPTMVG